MPRLLLVLASAALALALAVTALAAPMATLRLSADKRGALRFNASTLRVKNPGLWTILMRNPAVLPHNVAIRGNGVRVVGKVALKGGTSTVTAKLKRGRYVFFCSVPGHEPGGMKGVLIVG